jgi:tetratricopeptide (TPR) repeat protein
MAGEPRFLACGLQRCASALSPGQQDTGRIPSPAHCRCGQSRQRSKLQPRALLLIGWNKGLISQALNNLAELYQYQGRFPEAERLFRRTLAVREKALGPEHPDIGESLHNLAFLFQEQGRYNEAEPFGKRSLAHREKAFGPEHPTVAQALYNVINEQVFGPEHSRVGTALNSLATLYLQLRRFSEAEPLYRAAWQFTRRRWA